MQSARKWQWAVSALTGVVVLAGGVSASGALAASSKTKKPPLPIAGGHYWANTSAGTREQIVINRHDPRKIDLVAGGFTCNGQQGLFTAQNLKLTSGPLKLGRKTVRMYKVAVEIQNTVITFVQTLHQEQANVTVVVDVQARNHLFGGFRVSAPGCSSGDVVFDNAHVKK